MATRHALLIALDVLLAAALMAEATVAQPGAKEVVAGASCLNCHPAHTPARGVCVSCHRGDPFADRPELAHHRLLTGVVAEHLSAAAPAVRAGERRAEQLACRRCHRIAGRGNQLATDLDRVVWEREQQGVLRSIAQPVEHMPRFGLDETRTEELGAYLFHSADAARAEATYRVRFARLDATAGVVFSRQCGGCHRALLPRGAAGVGIDGPNLSGLFSGFYPPTAPELRRWTSPALAAWLENPRAARSRTLMRPVRFEPGDLKRLLDELGGEATALTP